MTDPKELATEERRDLADLLDSLTPEQWQQPSLCAGWTVRDVVAHVISYEELSILGTAGAFVRGGFSPKGVNRMRMDTYRHHEPAQLVTILRDHLVPRGLTTAFGGRIGLTDALIHHQDIRRPLGLHRQVPPERLLEALPFSLRAPVLPSRRHARGLRLVATDLDWQDGDGDEVRGSGEALLLALAGRDDALGELEGPGVVTLEARVRTAPAP
jgi:uncharacterized protein (TIGR03083 family)